MAEPTLTITSREIALAVIPHITGGLSVLGSSIIAGRVLLSQRRRKKTYHRLVCALSIFDFISSFSYAMSTWPIPHDSGPNVEWNSPYVYGAIGNDATCIAQGFGIQLGITAAFYNVMLSIHYILTIKYNIPEHILKQKAEPYMLTIPIVLGLALSIPPLVLNLYNNSKLWCWIGPNFDQCEMDGLTPEQCSHQVYIYKWIFYYGPCWLSLLIITCLQIWLVVTVYQTEQRTKKYTDPTRQLNTTTSAKSIIKQSQTSTTSNSSSSSSDTRNTSNDDSPLKGTTSADTKTNDAQQQDVASNAIISNDERKKRKKQFALKNASSMFESIRRSALRRTRSAVGLETRSTKSKQQKSKDHERSLTKEVAFQASLYVGIFYITWIPKPLTSITTGMKTLVTPDSNCFYLLLLIVIVTPLQGFMNLFVHIRKTIIEFLQKILTTSTRRLCRRNVNDRCCFRPSFFKKHAEPNVNDSDHYNDVEKQQEEENRREVK